MSTQTGPASEGERQALALLRLLAASGEISEARAAKRLALPASALRRLLAALGDDPALGGAGLVERVPGTPPRLRLAARGRALVGPG